MQTAIIVAGFGGQGVLFASQILAQAGLIEGKNVTWIPSYGPEMRGGTAHVTVTVGDDRWYFLLQFIADMLTNVQTSIRYAAGRRYRSVELKISRGQPTAILRHPNPIHASKSA